MLNQNVHAQESLYKNRESHTKLLLGTKYALLRREFVSAKPGREFSSVACNLLVSMGGSDPDNATVRVMEAIEQVNIEGLRVIVVAGGSNPHLAVVAEAVARSNHSCRILNDVTNMAKLISWADLAISAAGTACWEYCALGLPALLVALRKIRSQMQRSCTLPVLRDWLAADPNLLFARWRKRSRPCDAPSERQDLSRTARALVDGGGAARTVEALLSEEICKFLSRDRDITTGCPSASRDMIREWRNLPKVADYMYTDHVNAQRSTRSGFRVFSMICAASIGSSCAMARMSGSPICTQSIGRIGDATGRFML